MVEKNKRNSDNDDTDSSRSRDLLLCAAKEVFAEKGYEGATVKDLADAAGVNVSLVSYYFNGKEGLFKACLEGFGRQAVDSAQRLLKSPSTMEEFRLRLQLFVEHFIALNRDQPSICRIIHRDFEFQDARQSETAKIVLGIFKESFLPMHHCLTDFVRTAQKRKIIRASVDIDVATGLLFGSLIQIIRMDEKRKLLLGSTLLGPNQIDRTVQQYIDIFTHGLFAEST